MTVPDAAAVLVFAAVVDEVEEAGLRQKISAGLGVGSEEECWNGERR